MPGLLQHSPARIIGQLLVDNGYGTDPENTVGGEWPVYIGGDPDRPDNTIKIIDTQGRDNGYLQTGELEEWHGLQITIRCTDYELGRYKAHQIATFLDAVLNEAVNVDDAAPTGTGTDVASYKVTSVVRTSGPISLGTDTPGGRRQLFTTNILASLRMCC